MRFGIKNRLITVFFLFDFDLHIKVYDCFALVIYFKLCVVDFERLYCQFKSSESIKTRQMVHLRKKVKEKQRFQLRFLFR